MYQIRSRPKDQSSDEDENEENKRKNIIPASTVSTTPNDEEDHHQSVSAHIDVDIADDDTNNVSAVDMG